MSQVPPTRTPFTPTSLLAGLSWAYRQQMGHEPANEVRAILCAQVALETGNGAACVQNNIGNVRRGPGPDWCVFDTTEWIDGKRWEGPGEFSAWPSLGDGCQFFVGYLSTRYSEAWTAAVKSDVEAFAAGLRQRGYYTAPEQAYAAGVRRWNVYYLALLAGDPAPTEPELGPLGTGLLAWTGLADA